MPFFKDNQNKVHFLEDNQSTYLLPADCVEITDTEADLLQRQPDLTLNQIVARQLALINFGCEAAIASITASYPFSEVLSWPKQEAEARAYIADNAAATPLLDALAQARGVAKADLAARVIAKADAFAEASGSLIGKRQALEDQLIGLPADATPEHISAIVWA